MGAKQSTSNVSRCGSLLPAASADARASDDVIAFEGSLWRVVRYLRAPHLRDGRDTNAASGGGD